MVRIKKVTRRVQATSVIYAWALKGSQTMTLALMFVLCRYRDALDYIDPGAVARDCPRSYEAIMSGLTGDPTDPSNGRT